MKYCTKCGTQIPDETMVCSQCKQAEAQYSQAPQPKIKSNKYDSSHKNINKHNIAFLCPIIIGVILILIGILIQVPGGILTTYEFLDGRNSDNHVFDNKYSSIDEYVGGDAYNYIIGASLVAGKISGIMTTKAILSVGGTLCVCLGITLMLWHRSKNHIENSITDKNADSSVI